MQNKINYEKKRYRDKLREIMTLFFFTIGACIISLIVMDILILPVALFAINKKNLFNYLMKDLLVIVIIILAVLFLARKIYGYMKDGLSMKEVAKYLLYRPVHLLGSFFLIVLLTSMVIMILYLILNFNNYQIYRFIQG